MLKRLLYSLLLIVLLVPGVVAAPNLTLRDIYATYLRCASPGSGYFIMGADTIGVWSNYEHQNLVLDVNKTSHNNPFYVFRHANTSATESLQLRVSADGLRSTISRFNENSPAFMFTDSLANVQGVATFTATGVAMIGDLFLNTGGSGLIWGVNDLFTWNTANGHILKCNNRIGYQLRYTDGVSVIPGIESNGIRLYDDSSTTAPRFTGITDTNTGFNIDSDIVRMITGGILRFQQTTTGASFTTKVSFASDVAIVGSLTVNGAAITPMNGNASQVTYILGSTETKYFTAISNRNSFMLTATSPFRVTVGTTTFDSDSVPITSVARDAGSGVPVGVQGYIATTAVTFGQMGN